MERVNVTTQKKLITVVIPCFNEEGNVRALYDELQNVFSELPCYDREYLFIDNRSTDRTVPILRELATEDRRVKVIINARNFGPIRSPFYGMLQAQGDAVVLIVADLQDPPALIVDFVRKWEEGYRVAVGVKEATHENAILAWLRRGYYAVVTRIAEIDLIKNFYGYGLYDRKVVDALRGVRDAYPYFRGLVCELGFPRAEIPYTQRARKSGRTSTRFYSLYDYAMLGITTHSKVPLRMATITGFVMSVFSFFSGVAYLVYKLLYWRRFETGIAPLVIGQFFLGSVLLLSIGLVGEYVGFIHTQCLGRPLVIEDERINFDRGS